MLALNILVPPEALCIVSRDIQMHVAFLGTAWVAGGSLFCIQSYSIGRRLLGLPIWSRAALHRMGKVVSCLTRAASANSGKQNAQK